MVYNITSNVYVHNSNNWILNQIKYNLNAQMMNICTNIVTKTIEAQHTFAVCHL